MTNLQHDSRNLSSQALQRLWLWVPAGALGVVALLVLAVAVLPELGGLQRDSQRLEELEGMQQQLSLLRNQLKVLDENQAKAQTQQARLFQLITGSGDLSTFLAALDRTASQSGVQLDLYEPQGSLATTAPAAGRRSAAPAPPGANTGGANTPGAAPAGQAGQPSARDPLEVDGLRRKPILLSARGSYPALLDFLRRLEAVNVLVVQSDLKLSLEDDKAKQAPRSTSQPRVELKLALSLYDREATKGRARPLPPPAAAPPN